MWEQGSESRSEAGTQVPHAPPPPKPHHPPTPPKKQEKPKKMWGVGDWGATPPPPTPPPPQPPQPAHPPPPKQPPGKVRGLRRGKARPGSRAKVWPDSAETTNFNAENTQCIRGTTKKGGPAADTLEAHNGIGHHAADEHGPGRARKILFRWRREENLIGGNPSKLTEEENPLKSKRAFASGIRQLRRLCGKVQPYGASIR